jgi:hypothetical protein
MNIDFAFLPNIHHFDSKKKFEPKIPPILPNHFNERPNDGKSRPNPMYVPNPSSSRVSPVTDEKKGLCTQPRTAHIASTTPKR